MQLILGFFQNDQPHLLSYNCDNEDGYREIKVHDKSIQIGNLGAAYQNFSKDVSNLLWLKQKELSDDEVLVMLCTAHLQISISGDLLRKGVGGFFSGNYINKEGVTWLKDTTFILYSLNEEEIRKGTRDPNIIFPDAVVINQAIRDEVVVVETPYGELGDQWRVFRNCIRPTATKREREERQALENSWNKKWHFTLRQELGNAISDYYCFMTRKDDFPLKITLVSKNDNENKGWFTLKRIDDDGLFQTAFKDDFLKNLFPLSDPSAPFVFQWLRSESPEN
ncbi:hypothetical protein [Flavilitoribacter nigricans]|uniref:Uncharacterized protein n=1 Tax=Flavilitoribacter nigricans (strain ATCC 23147 / DSM 23189 / NBRC 102662 / NCIMB 1420 / SS-2) TaxID=1122177 RepID=A0A2D0N6X2_FLAN2|nr:hypothetical protein [Flavilitoribacter nigricans]PHN03879.1 hypothetical protein CRP01_23680 [Flavilitoribacter nigricans DSM 23189 = NBRC 102662]